MPVSMSGDVAARVTAFLDAHHVMSLATWTPHGAHAANLFYCRDGFSLMWVSDAQTRHSLALEANPRVGATVAPDYCDFDQICGLQILGEAYCVIEPTERRFARTLLETRYPTLHDLLDGSALKDTYDAAEPYRLVPHEIVIIDNRRGFGSKDVLDFRSRQ